MPPTQRDARLAGLLYLPVVFLGPVVLLFIPGKIFVPGDASATVANLLAHESLFRANIVLGMISQLFFVASALALYQLLRDVGRRLAALMVILILLVAPLANGAAYVVLSLAVVARPAVQVRHAADVRGGGAGARGGQVQAGPGRGWPRRGVAGGHRSGLNGHYWHQ